jgi:TolB-like protein/cytochrome c-type biogenesis protein CcmH/NrfG
MTTPGYQRFFAELKRRRVFRVMAVYGAVAFVILQVADIALPGLGLPEWTITLILALTLLGFPLAIVLAWAFDMTPEGMQRTADATPAELTQIIAAPASQRWPAGLLALVGMTALLAGAWYVGRQSAPETSADLAAAADPAAGPPSESIAVLPFADMSPDRDQEYFSDGISEELLNLLARIPELRVASRTSAFSFKGANLEIPEIAERLNVAHVLEGSVRKAGNQVRVTAQLIDARSDTHVWSQTWDRSLDDIFQIQDEIATDVVDHLKVTLLGGAPTVEEADPEAYALYLQALQLHHQGTDESIESSVALLKQALRIDPDYASAWSGLASNYNWQTSNGGRPIDEGTQLAREAAERALAIDAENAQAYAELGRIAMAYDGDLEAAAGHLERALALEPGNTEILVDANVLNRILGHLDEAIAISEYTVARDPVNATGHFYLGLNYFYAGRLDEARASSETTLSLAPGRAGVKGFISEVLLWKNEPEAALAAIQQESSETWRTIGLPMAYHALGKAAESDAALAELIEEYEEGAAYNIAYVYAFRGEADSAFEWLDKAVQYNDPGLSDIAATPEFANIHDDPRWLPFLESIGKSPEQLAAIEFEVTLPQ